MQVRVTPMAASTSAQMITGAIDSAIESGFNDNPSSIVPNGSGFTANLFADPTGQAAATADNGARDFIRNPLDRNANRRVDDSFAALGYANKMPLKAAPQIVNPPRDWLAWIDVRGMSLVTASAINDLRGNQIGTLLGLTRKLSPNLLVGGFGGYEYFSYSSDALNSQLKGNGWTAGTYLSWRFSEGLRFDISAARSQVDFSGISGSASTSFAGHRWLMSGGVTGNYKWQGFNLVPSAKVYGLWEHENGYIDSLGIAQPDRNFSTGRASGGLKVGYPLQWGNSNQITAYLGLYGDYYFSSDDAMATAIAGIPLLQGRSARATGDISMKIANGALLDLGGAYGGIGSTTRIWTYHGRLRVPF
jgi:outer membrane autotransporter protein